MGILSGPINDVCQRNNPRTTLHTADPTVAKEAKITTKKEYLAAAFMVDTDKNIYWKFTKELENNYRRLTNE